MAQDAAHCLVVTASHEFHCIPARGQSHMMQMVLIDVSFRLVFSIACTRSCTDLPIISNLLLMISHLEGGILEPLALAPKCHGVIKTERAHACCCQSCRYERELAHFLIGKVAMAEHDHFSRACVNQSPDKLAAFVVGENHWQLNASCSEAVFAAADFFQSFMCASTSCHSLPTVFGAAAAIGLVTGDLTHRRTTFFLPQALGP